MISRCKYSSDADRKNSVRDNEASYTNDINLEEFESNVWNSKQLTKVSFDDDCKTLTRDNDDAIHQ